MAFSVLLSCPTLSDPGPGGHVPQQRQEGGDAVVAVGLSLAEAGRLPGQDHLLREEAGDGPGLILRPLQVHRAVDLR